MYPRSSAFAGFTPPTPIAAATEMVAFPKSRLNEIGADG